MNERTALTDKRVGSGNKRFYKKGRAAKIFSAYCKLKTPALVKTGVLTVGEP